MINSNDRLKHKYAYNINDTTKVKKVTMGSGKDFLSLNRGFYDDIENNDINIKKKNHQLKKIKNESLKEFVFTNVQIPDKWRTKLDYQNSVIKMLARDNNFLAYVGRGGSKNETASTKMYTRDNFNMGLKKNRGMSTCYSQVFPKIDKNKISFEDKKVSNEITPNKYKSMEEEDVSIKEIDNSNINSGTRISFPKGKNKKETMNEKDIVTLLEDFKMAYPIKLPKEEEEQIEKIQEKENKMNKTNLLFSQTFNYNQLLQKNIKYNAFDNFHKIRIKRQRAFRQNIFNNLIPPKKATEGDSTNNIQSYKKLHASTGQLFKKEESKKYADLLEIIIELYKFKKINLEQKLKLKRLIICKSPKILNVYKFFNTDNEKFVIELKKIIQ